MAEAIRLREAEGESPGPSRTVLMYPQWPTTPLGGGRPVLTGYGEVNDGEPRRKQGTAIADQGADRH